MGAHLTLPKDARRAVAEAVRVGFTVETGRGHIKLRCPDGHAIAISCSASDGNAARCVIRDINRARARCGV